MKKDEAGEEKTVERMILYTELQEDFCRGYRHREVLQVKGTTKCQDPKVEMTPTGSSLGCPGGQRGLLVSLLHMHVHVI